MAVPRKGTRNAKPVTKADVVAAHTQAQVMIGWLDGKEDLLERAGVDPIARIELESAIESIETEVKQPKAKTMMLAALSAGMSKEMVLTLYHRTISAMHAMAPVVALKLAEKMDDHQAPGSTRVLIAMAKGLGLFVSAEPMAARNRGDILAEDSLSGRSAADLKAEILGQI
jgi:hypothetical protein